MYKKLKHLPFNLFWCLPSIVYSLLIITFALPAINVWLAVGISVYIYLTKVGYECEIDVFNERIKNLEELLPKITNNKPN